ncbi:hypothetical protein AMECASPLE_027086, partial [Ameca splendens]
MCPSLAAPQTYLTANVLFFVLSYFIVNVSFICTDPKKPSSGDSGGFGFDLEDALKPGSTLEPKKPAIKPPSGGGGGNFDDKDLFDVSDGGYKPDGGRSGGRAVDPGYDNQ